MPQQGRDVISKLLTTFLGSYDELLIHDSFFVNENGLSTFATSGLTFSLHLARSAVSEQPLSHGKKISFNRRAREVPVSLLGRYLSIDGKCGLWCPSMGSGC
jgi:hypothetical protein